MLRHNTRSQESAIQCQNKVCSMLHEIIYISVTINYDIDEVLSPLSSKFVRVCFPSPLHDCFHLTVFSYADTLWFWTHKPWGHNSFLVIRISINNGSNSPSSNTDFLWPTGSGSVECQGYPSALASGSTLDSAQIRRTPST